jgi:hypothetical protein
LLSSIVPPQYPLLLKVILSYLQYTLELIVPCFYLMYPPQLAVFTCTSTIV